MHRIGFSIDRITPRSAKKKGAPAVPYSPCGNCTEELIPGCTCNKRSVRNTGSKNGPARCAGGHLRHSPRGRSSLRKRTFVPSSCITDPWAVVCPHARGLIDLREGTHGKRALSCVRETYAQTCDSFFSPSIGAACCFVVAHNVISAHLHVLSLPSVGLKKARCCLRPHDSSKLAVESHRVAHSEGQLTGIACRVWRRHSSVPLLGLASYTASFRSRSQN